MPSKYKAAFGELSSLFTAESNYINYRDLVVTHVPPMIPYLGVFLKDLTFLDIGNSKYLDEAETKLNFDKLRMIAKVISEVHNFQKIPYQFEEITAIQKLLFSIVTPFDEDQLYNISRILEPPAPKGAKKEVNTSLMGKIRKKANA